MKVVILAGGLGTRISEESTRRPKPMVEIGGMPILWHIMKMYSVHGLNDFVICAGYKQHMIKEYFADYYLHRSDITFDFANKNEIIVHNNVAEPWKVTVVDTGLDTMTGGRVKRIARYLDDEPFCLTYGDGVSDINISTLVKHHFEKEKMVTLSAYNVEQRFGVLDISKNGLIEAFREKAKDDGALINIGFMVCNPEFLSFIENDETVLEKKPLEDVAKCGQLMSYKHDGFWQCMDTLREKQKLELLWASGKAPWKTWEG